jgi:hypothetical protein
MAAGGGPDLTRFAAGPGTVLYELGLKDFNTFKDVVTRHKLKIQNKDLQYIGNRTIGVHLLTELINKKLKKQVKHPDPEIRKKLASRLKYFNSEDFIDNFLQVLPTRDTWGQYEKPKSASYTLLLNTLFRTNYKEWRDDMLTNLDNQGQCKAALDYPSARPVTHIQDNDRVVCYLCGNQIHTGEPTMQCEHILPIVTALAHVWLVERPIKLEVAEALAVEYAWAHQCCNQIKSNYDFIKSSKSKASIYYEFNEPLVKQILNKIDSSINYDCNPIKNAKQNLTNVEDTVEPLLTIINDTITKIGNFDYYILLTKFKLLSALTNENFIRVLLGQNIDGTFQPTRPLYNPAAREAARARSAQLEAEIQAEEAEIQQARRQGSATRGERLALRAGAGGGAGSNRYGPRTQRGGAGEDIDFPDSFFAEIIGFAARHGIALPFEQLIPAYILFNPEFLPTDKEIHDITLVVQSAQLQNALAKVLKGSRESRGVAPIRSVSTPSLSRTETLKPVELPVGFKGLPGMSEGGSGMSEGSSGMFGGRYRKTRRRAQKRKTRKRF